MKRLSTLLIIMGLIVASIPVAGHIYTSYKQDQLYQQYLADLGESDRTPDIPDIPEPEAPAEGEPQPPSPAASVEGVMGTLSIPAINSQLLLLEGSGSKQLKYGAGHLTGTALPGKEGNCSVAGHRNYTFGTYFNRIDELKTGDTIEVSYEDSSFIYAVFESFVVEPTDISVLEDTGESVITLITCHPKGSNAQRLIVRGRLI